MRRPQISVIGSHDDERFLIEARDIGRHIAKRGWVLICGGRGGIMEAASRGASEEGGMVIGILPGSDFGDANQYLGATILSGIGYARNSMNVLSGDVVIAIGGRTGTLTELSYAFQYGKPIIICSFAGGWSTDFARLALADREGSLIHQAKTVSDATALLDSIVSAR